MIDHTQTRTDAPLILLRQYEYMVRRAKRIHRIIEALSTSLRNQNASIATTIDERGAWAVMGDPPERDGEGWTSDRIDVNWGFSRAGASPHAFLAAQWLRSSLLLEFHDVVPYETILPTATDQLSSLDAIMTGFRDLTSAPCGPIGSQVDTALHAMKRNAVDSSEWVEVHMPSPFGDAWAWTQDRSIALDSSNLPACGVVTATTYGTDWKPGPGFTAMAHFRSIRESIADGTSRGRTERI